jgi:hypothetical protein
MSALDQRKRGALSLCSDGVCIMRGEAQPRTIELITKSMGSIRITVTHWIECGRGRRVASPRPCGDEWYVP